VSFALKKLPDPVNVDFQTFEVIIEKSTLFSELHKPFQNEVKCKPFHVAKHCKFYLIEKENYFYDKLTLI